MPLYEYFCRACNEKFELLRSMSRSEEPANCPKGHPRAARTLSVFASVGRANSAASYDAPSSGGGCGCGGACSCGGH